MHGTPRSCGSSPMPLSAKRWPWILRMFSGERNRMSHFGATTFCSSRPARAERPLCAPLKRQFKQEHLPSGGYPEAGPESCENKGGPEAIGFTKRGSRTPECVVFERSVAKPPKHEFRYPREQSGNASDIADRARTALGSREAVSQTATGLGCGAFSR